MDIYEMPPADFIPTLTTDANIKLAADPLGNQGCCAPTIWPPRSTIRRPARRCTTSSQSV